MSIDIIIPRRGINDENRGKKHALHRLIAASAADYVWLQDDDILPPSASEEEVLAAVGDADMLILPLRMESTRPNPSLLERLQIAEYAAIQQLTIATAQRGHSVLCSGANLLVKRKAWLESEGDLHPEIPSGDDMFLLEAFKRKGLIIRTIARNCPPAQQERLTAVVRPVANWKAFFRQRMRWAGKAPHYTDRDILCCGMVVAIANIVQVLFPPVLLVKFPLEYSLIRKRDPQVSLVTALLLEVCYPFYMMVCLIGGLFRRAW